jgi:hypothetical protein
VKFHNGAKQMSLWLEILKYMSIGNSSEAHRLMNFELPQALRWAEVNHEGEWRYTGPVPKIVRIFIASLPEADREMAKSRSEDFVDYICDLILAKVRRTVSLLEFCRTYPDLSIEEIADKFTGWDGLKLGREARAKWVHQHLQSISLAGIEITSIAKEGSQTDSPIDDDLYGYNELALVNRWRANLSWKDFKEQEEIDSTYLSVSDFDSEDDPGVAEETLDYGALSAARVVLNLSESRTEELTIDLKRIGVHLTANLLDLLETFHADKPSDGYFPIAWHNVWWTILYRYQAIPLDLNERDPCCDVDRTLAEYIGSAYPAVTKPNRLNIQRRRAKLQDECVDRIQSVLIAWNEGGP